MYFLLIRTQLQFLSKSQDGQQNGTLAHVKRKVATALSMKLKPVKKYRHSCAFAPISAVEACLENSPSSLHVLFCCNFYSLEAASKPALKPAARLILKDCLFCSKFAWREPELQQRMHVFFPVLQKARCFALTLLSPLRVCFAWHVQYFWQSRCEN